jgi:hypothetical protein
MEVGKSLEIKIRRSRAGWLAIIIVSRNTGAARSGKANRLYLNRNSATLGGQKEIVYRDISRHPDAVTQEKMHYNILPIDRILRE